MVAVLIGIGVYIGIVQVDEGNTALYGVTIVFYTQFADLFQFVLKQFGQSESYMVSSERVFRLLETESEKELRVDYDQEVGLGN